MTLRAGSHDDRSRDWVSGPDAPTICDLSHMCKTEICAKLKLEQS
jgi:hypothetical protein